MSESEHTFTVEAAGRLFIIACSCGYRSEPVHLINTELTRQTHLAAATNESEPHEHSREERGRVVRVTCSCGHRGPWRSRTSFLVEKQLHSDDGGHLYTVRRGEA